MTQKILSFFLYLQPPITSLHFYNKILDIHWVYTHCTHYNKKKYIQFSPEAKLYEKNKNSFKADVCLRLNPFTDKIIKTKVIYWHSVTLSRLHIASHTYCTVKLTTKKCANPWKEKGASRSEGYIANVFVEDVAVPADAAYSVRYAALWWDASTPVTHQVHAQPFRPCRMLGKVRLEMKSFLFTKKISTSHFKYSVLCQDL
jgi:hypothetical protein